MCQERREQQQGFFTTKLAKAAGFAENMHPYHVRDEIEKDGPAGVPSDERGGGS